MKRSICLLAMSLFLALSLVQPSPAQGVFLPIELKAVNASTNSITLSWKVQVNEPVKGFEVQRSAGTPEYALLAATAGLQSNYTDTTVQPGVVYTYRVRALLEKPGSAAYSAFSPTVQAVAIPGTPVLSCSERTANTATTQLSWGAVPGAAGYEIYQSMQSRDQFNPYELLAETAGPGYLKSGMNSILDYKFKIRACTMLGGRKVFGEFSNSVLVKHVSQNGDDGILKKN